MKKVGDRFRVLEGCQTFKPGSVVELIKIEPDHVHDYKLVTGECYYGTTAFIMRYNVTLLENEMTIGTDSQTRDELVQENRSLSKQISSLAKRQEFLAKEVLSLGDRIKRKQAFRVGNTDTLKAQKIAIK